MYDDCETLTVKIQGAFDSEERVTLVRRSDGLYHEIDEPFHEPEGTTQPEWTSKQQPDSQPEYDALTATLPGRFGEEHHIRLVRRPNGEYVEELDTCDAGQV